jgi:PIN domain nuclease of toxin-antitoxin system
VRILLDTHIWLWYLLGDKRLSRKQRAALDNPDNELFLSPVSIWEAHLLIERGRLAVKGTPASWIGSALSELPLKESPLTFPIALRSRRLKFDHGDPADRFLVATALENSLTLATADERLRKTSEIDLL